MSDKEKIRRCDKCEFWFVRTCDRSALSGCLECLKYLHENGRPWDEWTYSDAAYNSHLDCLKYAHENGCPWNITRCDNAAVHGHLEYLKYAHENGCPWDEETCRFAVCSRRIECINMLTRMVVHEKKELVLKLLSVDD